MALGWVWLGFRQWTKPWVSFCFQRGMVRSCEIRFSWRRVAGVMCAVDMFVPGSIMHGGGGELSLSGCGLVEVSGLGAWGHAIFLGGVTGVWWVGFFMWATAGREWLLLGYRGSRFGF